VEESTYDEVVGTSRRVSESAWPSAVVDASLAALAPLADPDRAVQMAAYMKGIAPFLGIYAQPRRAALRREWKALPAPTSDELGRGALALMHLPEREYHYAAYDLIDRYRRYADSYFLREYGGDLLTTTPWWDTVDGLVNAAVSPLSRTYPAPDLIDEWSQSGDRWLVRAAIGHQRGWRGDTDVPRVLALCDRHWNDPEFFVAKAIGWALRDLAAIDHVEVETFLDAHPHRNVVAVREAQRGLQRLS